MSKKAIYFLKFFLPGVFITLFILGNLHSYHKHPGDNHNPFLMIYRGAEFFWHVNLTEVEWDEQLKNDTQSVFNLLTNATTHERSNYAQEKKVKVFRSRIKNYPKDKILFLKKAGVFYLAYSSSLDSDLMKRIIGDTMYYTPNFLSARTKILMDSITEYQKVNQAKSILKAFKKVWGDKDSVIKLNPNARDVILANDNKERKEMKEIYETIFKGL